MKSEKKTNVKQMQKKKEIKKNKKTSVRGMH